MSSPILTAHKCNCIVPKLGIVDGDTEAVYCANCEGVLGNTCDFYGVLTIEVKQSYTYPEVLSITINDECDHAGAEVEMLEYSKSSFWADAGIYVNDDSEELPTLVCKCGFEEVQEREEPDYDE